MRNNLDKIPLRIRLINLYALIFILCGSIIIGSVVFLKSMEFLLGVPITNASGLFKSLENTAQAQQYLLTAQALTALISFVFIPLLVIFFIWPDLKIIFQFNKAHAGEMLLLAVLTTLVSIPLIALLSEWNRSLLVFPESLKSIETWMKASESEAEKLTNYLAYYSNSIEFWGGLLVIAILPAVGEELLFRGVLQTQLTKVFLNPHIGIFVTAFLFSFIHFQFYGFLPRMFLGAIFGYLFYWSGSIWIPIAMHFTQNAMTYFALNFYKQKKMSIDLESAKDLSPISFIFSALVCATLLYRFYLLKQKNKDKIWQ